MYCLFQIKNKLLFKHMPDTTYVNVFECYQVWTVIYTCVQITCACLYTWGYMHMRTQNCVQMRITQCQFSSGGLFLYYCTIHNTVLEENKSINPIPTYFIQALYFVFNSNRITWYLWKASGFQTACQSPKKFLVTLLLLLLESGTRRTSGYPRLNPSFFCLFFALWQCSFT